MKSTHHFIIGNGPLTVIINNPSIFPVDQPLMPSVFPVADPIEPEPEILLEGVGPVAEMFNQPPQYINEIAEEFPDIIAAIAQFPHVDGNELIHFFGVIFMTVDKYLFEGAPEVTLDASLKNDQFLTEQDISKILDDIACELDIDLSDVDVTYDVTMNDIIFFAGDQKYPKTQMPFEGSMAKVPEAETPYYQPSIGPTTGVQYVPLSVVQERLVRMISDHMGLDPNRIGMSSSFVSGLGCDSLDIVELIMGAEDEFGLDLPDDAMETCITIADAVHELYNRIRVLCMK